eukprot:CAMPEP_0172528930 /NCGR_PEP_ID=MMETSP1067-20121228/3140_1 /TAXON_ID=265564 ORGANISM="Thalassiosira punctigera, Strain Tpunct2005C2" /NCGR_SAMPLE_ID=MMETSP1067 /ASSEMBLY_ACC=CAM_ASM_000444 /LENGTH=261 /DNA_ID=CAMNT_0013312909 /DNA_START=80 /DNA_END=865 /DNA_ORIENTATION=-
MRSVLLLSAAVASFMGGASAFNAFASMTKPKPVVSDAPPSKMPMFEYLKFDKNPTFDVLAKTKQYVESQSMGGQMSEEWYAEDYVLRGPVIGPINRSDLRASQKGLGIVAAFPDIKIDTFGYSVDPENPYRCFYFQRWRATHIEDMDVYGTVYPPTGKEMETPVATFCAVWNPEGKIIYEQVGAVVDRLEGNTEGKAAVFGLIHTGGVKLSATPGDAVFSFIQRVGHWVGNQGRSWSREDEIPKWWISPSRGADAEPPFEE